MSHWISVFNNNKATYISTTTGSSDGVPPSIWWNKNDSLRGRAIAGLIDEQRKGIDARHVPQDMSHEKTFVKSAPYVLQSSIIVQIG